MQFIIIVDWNTDLDPVLSVGLYESEDLFVNKRILVGVKSDSSEYNTSTISPWKTWNLEGAISCFEKVYAH